MLRQIVFHNAPLLIHCKSCGFGEKNTIMIHFDITSKYIDDTSVCYIPLTTRIYFEYLLFPSTPLYSYSFSTFFPEIIPPSNYYVSLSTSHLILYCLWGKRKRNWNQLTTLKRVSQERKEDSLYITSISCLTNFSRIFPTHHTFLL